MIFERLFAPLRIKNLTLKNRTIMTAFQTNFAQDGKAGARFREFYWKRAEGGAALLIVGGARFDRYGAAGHDFLSIENDSFLPELQLFTAGVHQRGAKTAIQLYHAGRYTKEKNLPAGEKALAPSAVYSTYTREVAKEASVEELQEVIRRWAEGADRAKRAGFDAVEIVGSAGYLISQFLSPLTNQRTDQYGGSWENRTRFPLEVLAAVRKAVGPDFPILFRIAGNDFMPGSNTNREAVAFARLLEAAGVDMISVTGGWHETRVPQLPGEVPPGCFAYLAAAVKEAVSVPVVVSNRINDPVVAEEILAMEQADCIGMSRTLVADPDWPRKTACGQLSAIRPCVACNQGCLANTFFGRPVCCLANGEAGYEDEVELPPAEHPKKLLVVGGGPAGLEAALRLAQKGHQVTLWEAGDHLGGHLPVAAAPPGKGDFLHLLTYWEHMLRENGVQVETGRRAEESAILAGGFDGVVLATGSQPRTIPLPAEAGSLPIYMAEEVLSGKRIPGKRVVIVGGGAVGCETAEFLARQGTLSPEQLYFLAIHRAEQPEVLAEKLDHSAREIAIVEVAPKIGSGFDPGCGWPVLDDLKRLGVTQYPSSQITKISSDTVSFVQQVDGTEVLRELPCDALVLSVGYVADQELYHRLEGKLPVYLLGDASKPRRVLDAVHEAVLLAARL